MRSTGTVMLVLIGLLGSIIAIHGTCLRCEERLDVVSKSAWPALPATYFGRNLLDEAEIVAVGYTAGSTHAVLNTANKDVFLRGRSELFHLYGNMTRELVEMRGYRVKDVRFGWTFIVILTEDGSVWTAGENESGQLGHHGTTDYPVFSKVKGLPPVKVIAVGSRHCVVLTNNGMLFSWGRNTNGQLGYTTSNHTNPNPRRLDVTPGRVSRTHLCCGFEQCTLLTHDSSVFTWGYTSYTGRPHGGSNPAQVPGILEGQDFIKVTCGEYHTILLSATGRLIGWGSNSYKQMGDASDMPEPGELAIGRRIVRDVVAGKVTTLIRTYSSVAEYRGHFDGRDIVTLQLATDFGHGRDVFTKSFFGQETYGAVQAGCTERLTAMCDDGDNE